MKAEFLSLKNKLKDPYWRLNNLYKIQDKKGNVVRFKMNKVQYDFMNKYHHRNVILKARQHGFTTQIDIFFLDTCLFNKNIKAGIIAHSLNDAAEIFRTKIKFPYENLPEEIRDNPLISARNDKSNQYVFNNGSSITVGTSFRSGTVQLLHISELAKISLKYPKKADEIQTGAIESVPMNGLIFIESTAEGAGGYFYDVYKKASDMRLENKTLSPLDYKDFFYAWHFNNDYRIDKKYYNKKYDKYFENLELEGLNLDMEQKAWYCLKCENLNEDKMMREYPSTPEEAFNSSLEGKYYTKQFRYLRSENRLGQDVYDKNLEVFTFWDIGHHDSTSIWFMQYNKHDKIVPYRIIDYHEESGEGFLHYVNVLKSKGYKYKKHYMPHDFGNAEYYTGLTMYQKALEAGINVDLVKKSSFQDGIDEVRTILKYCIFDKKTELGYTKLENYSKKWDDINGIWRESEHKHDENSHAADAFRYLAMQRKIIDVKPTTMLDIF